MIDLNVTGDNWNRNQRNGINENWQRIKNGLSNLQGQIKILAGGEEVDELLKRLNDAVESATVAVQESIDANNTATQDAITANNQALQIALNTISAALTDVGNAIQAAETATNDAMEAKDAALQAAGDAQTTISQMQVIIANFRPRGEWNATTDYFKNNLAGLNGKTYIALQNNTNKPVTDTSFWMLFADRGAKGERGEKGEPGTGIKVLGHFNDVSELPSNPTLGDAYTIGADRDLYVYNGNDWQNLGSIKGVEGKSAYEVAVENGFVGTEIEWLETLIGPPGPDGPPGPPADLTEINQKVDDLQTEVTAHLGHFDQLQGTVANQEVRITNLEQGGATNANIINGLNREVAYLKLRQEASERIEGGTVFADDFAGNRFGFTLNEDESQGVSIDEGKVYLEGEEVISKNYTGEVVFSDTPSNGRARSDQGFVQFDDGRFATIAVLNNSNNLGKVVVFDEVLANPIAPSGMAIAIDSAEDSFSMIAPRGKGTVSVARTWKTSLVSNMFDTNTLLNKQTNNITTNATSFNGVSQLYVESTNTWYILYSAKIPSHSVSYNLFLTKSTNDGVSYDTPEQITTLNNSGRDITYPTIGKDINNSPLLFYVATVGGNLEVRRWFAGAWTAVNISPQYPTRTQKELTTFTDSSDGHILIAWSGVDSTDTTTFKIRFNKSTNNGASFLASPIVITNGIKPTISVNNDGHYVIVYQTIEGKIAKVTSTDKGAVWSTPEILGNGVAPYTLRYGKTPRTSPLVVATTTSNEVNAFGSISGKSVTQKLEAKLVYDIPSTSFVGAFVDVAGTLVVEGSLNGQMMESSRENNEYELTKTLNTSVPAKLSLNLKRNSVTNGRGDFVERILGGRA